MNSQKAFKYALISIGMMGLLITITLLSIITEFSLYSEILGALVIIIGCIAIIGLVFSLKGIKDKNSFKKIIALIVNLSIVVLFISVMLANMMDIYQFLQ